MKKNTYFSVILATMVAMVSCDKNNDVENETLEVKFSSGITATPQPRVATTDAGISTWNVNDPIGIYMVAKGTTEIAESVANIPYKATTAAASTTFLPSGATTIYYPVNEPAKVDFIAYHPHSATVADWVYPVDVSEQDPQTDIDLMYARATNSNTGYDKRSGSVDFKFSHELVKLIIKLEKSDGVTGAVSGVEIHGMHTTANFDLEGEDGLTDKDHLAAIIPFTATAGSKYEAILLPTDDDLRASHYMTFKIGAGTTGETYTWAMSNDIDGGLEAGKIYIFTVTLTKYAVEAEGSINKWGVGTPAEGIAD